MDVGAMLLQKLIVLVGIVQTVANQQALDTVVPNLFNQNFSKFILFVLAVPVIIVGFAVDTLQMTPETTTPIQSSSPVHGIILPSSFMQTNVPLAIG